MYFKTCFHSLLEGKKRDIKEFWNTAKIFETRHHWILHVCKVKFSALKQRGQKHIRVLISFSFIKILFQTWETGFQTMTFFWKEKLPILIHHCTILSPRSLHSSPVNRGRCVASIVIPWTLQEFYIKLIVREIVSIMVLSTISLCRKKYLRQSTKGSVLTELCNHESRQGNDQKVKR